MCDERTVIVKIGRVRSCIFYERTFTQRYFAAVLLHTNTQIASHPVNYARLILVINSKIISLGLIW